MDRCYSCMCDVPEGDGVRSFRGFIEVVRCIVCHERVRTVKKPIVYTPTPEEIAERSAEIRSEWDEQTTEARQVYRPKVYTTPEVHRPNMKEGHDAT